MTIPGVGQLTALAFVTTIGALECFRRSGDVGAYLGLVPRRFQSGEVDYGGSISKCGDRRVRILPYEAANVMLMRYRGALALTEWALRIGPALDDGKGAVWRWATPKAGCAARNWPSPLSLGDERLKAIVLEEAYRSITVPRETAGSDPGSASGHSLAGR